MTPKRLTEITQQVGRKTVARVLGYKSDNSLRQCEKGEQSLPEDVAGDPVVEAFGFTSSVKHNTIPPFTGLRWI